MISGSINGLFEGVGRHDLVLSKSESQVVDLLAKPVEKYVWLALIVLFVLGFIVIILPRIVTILWERSRGK